MVKDRLSDIQTNSMVRKIFTRHHINMESLTFRTVGGKVCLFGWLEKLPIATSALNPDTVGAMMTEIERMPPVVRIADELQNWERSGKGWVLTPLGKQAVAKGRPRSRVRGRAISSFRIRTAPPAEAE